MTNSLKELIPLPLKKRIKKIRNRLANRQSTRLFGALAPLVPAVEDMFDGPQSMEEYKRNGEEFLKIYTQVCDLQPDEMMLDVGCGIGRKTLPLTQYLNEKAVYEGIDITKAGIDWCREKFTPRYPNFHFQQIDVYNKHYNPSGKCQSSQYKFPYADDFFSFVMLGSVFTHMLPDDVENYLSEVYRVLKKGGRCLVTYFLLNEESLRGIEVGDSTLDFRYVFDKYRTISLEVPEQAIAFDEGWIKDLYRKLGLKIMRVDYGSWCARPHYLSYQDLILGKKE
jgi:ubiquinone/menaquinone biosynthesis C-methylase UbiE